jgi:hypothetical protein
MIRNSLSTNLLIQKFKNNNNDNLLLFFNIGDDSFISILSPHDNSSIIKKFAESSTKNDSFDYSLYSYMVKYNDNRFEYPLVINNKIILACYDKKLNYFLESYDFNLNKINKTEIPLEKNKGLVANVYLNKIGDDLACLSSVFYKDGNSCLYNEFLNDNLSTDKRTCIWETNDHVFDLQITQQDLKTSSLKLKLIQVSSIRKSMTKEIFSYLNLTSSSIIIWNSCLPLQIPFSYLTRILKRNN